MTASNLLSNENKLSNQSPSDFLISKVRSTRSELSVFQTTFESFDNNSVRTSHSPAYINRFAPSPCHQPKHIFGSKLSSCDTYCDFSSVMNRYFDDTDDLNEAHTGESCAQTLSGKDERKVGVACSSDSFGFSGSSSYADGDAMRRNGEQILEAISNFPTPFQHSKMNLGPNLVKGEYLSGKGDAFDHGPELPSDDEDSLESIFDEPFEPESPSCLSASKRSHEDSFLSLIHVLAKTSSRRNSSTCTLTDLADQVGCVNNGTPVSLEEKAKVLFQNSRVLTPLTEMGDDARSPCAKRAKLNGGAQRNSPGTIQYLKRMCRCMKQSAQTMKTLQEWDRKNGLPKSHSQTMVNSSRSREQLQSGLVLQKWNGVPLLSLPGAKVKVIRRKFRGVKVAELEE